MYVGVRQAIDRQCQLNNGIWLIAHRQETFQEIQDELETWKLPYEIEMEPLTRDRLQPDDLLASGKIKLILSALIPEPISAQLADSAEQAPLSVMVLDRHHKLENDMALETFCRNLPTRVELGYFLSLDDDVVREVVDPTSRLVLEQLGLSRHELITSNLITKRINRHLRRQQT